MYEVLYVSGLLELDHQLMFSIQHSLCVLRLFDYCYPDLVLTFFPFPLIMNIFLMPPHQSGQGGHLTITTRPGTVQFTSSSLAFHHPRYSPCQDLCVCVCIYICIFFGVILIYFHQVLNFLSSPLPVHRPFVYSVDTSTAISPHTHTHYCTPLPHINPR
jgi:hypothetical protein